MQVEDTDALINLQLLSLCVKSVIYLENFVFEFSLLFLKKFLMTFADNIGQEGV